MNRPVTPMAAKSSVPNEMASANRRIAITESARKVARIAAPTTGIRIMIDRRCSLNQSTSTPRPGAACEHDPDQQRQQTDHHAHGIALNRAALQAPQAKADRLRDGGDDPEQRIDKESIDAVADFAQPPQRANDNRVVGFVDVVLVA